MVADAGVAEAEHAIALAQKIQPVTDGHIDRAAASREGGEEAVNDTRRLRTHRLVSLARQRPLEHRRYFRERAQVGVDRTGKMGGRFAHPS